MGQSVKGKPPFHSLREILEARFFEENASPFVLVYDKPGLLTGFFAQPRPNFPHLKILQIEANAHPVEFITREEVALDFNPAEGWYTHQWIIHVCGEQTAQVKNFRSFLYYEMLANAHKKVYVFDGLNDVLIHPDIDLLRSSTTDSMASALPALNSGLFTAVMDLPIEAYIDKGEKINEWGLWFLLFNMNSDLNPGKDSDSPVWASIVQDKQPITPAKVLLELIHRLDPQDLQRGESETAMHLAHFIREFVNHLKLPDLPVGENFADDLPKLLQFIMQNTKARGIKRKGGLGSVDKAKQISLDQVSKTTKTITLTPHAAEMLGAFLFEWLNSSDTVLTRHYRQWMGILRKKQSLPAIKPAKIAEYVEENLESFSYTGIMDASLAAKVLEAQNGAPLEARLWHEKFAKIVEKREKAWKDQARLWWDDRFLFGATDSNAGLTVKGLWDFVEKCGEMIASAGDLSDEWLTVSPMAWAMEGAYLALSTPRYHAAFKKEDCLAPLEKLWHQISGQMASLRERWNASFLAYYQTQLAKIGDPKSRFCNEPIWREIETSLTAGKRVALVCCDALRHDLSTEVSRLLADACTQRAQIVKHHQFDFIPLLSLLPSITNLGWNRFFAANDPLFVKIAAESIVSGVQVQGKNIVLNNPKDRVQRFQQVLAQKGVNIEPFELESAKFVDQKIELRQRLLQAGGESAPKVVPILFYEKIDNHEQSFDDFIKNIDQYLQELNQILVSLHTIGVETIFVMADHGFLFLEEKALLKELPSGILDKRFAISSTAFSKQEAEGYPNWEIVPFDSMQMAVDPKPVAVQSVIVPKGYGIFKKPRKTAQFYTHGGLSYQECDLVVLKSECVLKPEVQLEIITCENESLQLPDGKIIYTMMDMGDQYALQLQLVAKKKEEGGESLRPLTLKLGCEDARVTFDPPQELTLTSGKKRNVKVMLPKTYTASSVEILLKNAENEVIDKRSFAVQPPSVISGELF